MLLAAGPRDPVAPRAAAHRSAHAARAWLPCRRSTSRLAGRQIRPARHCRRVAASAWGAAVGGSSSEDSGRWEPPTSERRRLLTKFVQEADPGLMQQFESDAHPEVIIAMRQTITSMLGTLPPQFFRVAITTEAQHLAQLMFSVLMSGYMFANAWTRLSLTQSMAELPSSLREAEIVWFSSKRSSAAAAAAASAGSLAAAGGVEGLEGLEDGYAPGSQKLGVEGEVLRWHHENGKEVVPALQYIEQLEAELAALREQLAAQQQATARRPLRPLPGNELLEYLKALSPEEIMALTDCASEDVLEAMNLFVQRLMGMEEEAWDGGTSDCTASELAQLMYWLLITGYSLRQMEQRCDLTRTLDLPSPGGDEPPSLPPPGWGR